MEPIREVSAFKMESGKGQFLRGYFLPFTLISYYNFYEKLVWAAISMEYSMEP